MKLTIFYVDLIINITCEEQKCWNRDSRWSAVAAEEYEEDEAAVKEEKAKTHHTVQWLETHGERGAWLCDYLLLVRCLLCWIAFCICCAYNNASQPPYTVKHSQVTQKQVYIRIVYTIYTRQTIQKGRVCICIC